MNHTPSHIFSKSRLNGPEVGIKVAGNSPASTDGSSPVINAAEGSTVIYAAPGASIGHLAGIKPTDDAIPYEHKMITGHPADALARLAKANRNNWHAGGGDRLQPLRLQDAEGRLREPPRP